MAVLVRRRWARKRSQWHVAMWVVQWEAIVDRHDVRLGLADADKAGERACGIDLRHAVGWLRVLNGATLKRLKIWPVRSQASRGRRLRTRRWRPRTGLRLKTRRRQTSGCKETSRGGDVDRRQRC
jgi:hypothetical protein